MGIPIGSRLFVIAALMGLVVSAAGGEGLQMFNPAARYCEELGYTYLVESGECVLPNGETVSSWDFYRGKVGQEYSFCAGQGYEIATEVQDTGTSRTECAVCKTTDGVVVGRVDDLMGLFDLEPSGFSALAEDLDPESAAVIDRPVRDDLPSSFDWRELGGCTSVKDQGSCGSCWAFSTVGALECNILIKDNVEVDLSEQWLVSCNQDGWSCSGGYFAHDYHMWKTDPCDDTGAVLEAFFPYEASNLPCNCPYRHDYFIEDWSYIAGSGSIPAVDAMKVAIMEHGPISVAVASAGMSGYSGGIFEDCNHYDINHAVVLVGWDDDQGPNGVWFMRNSWGTDWGENGYMRMPYGCNDIGYGACYVEYREPLQVYLPDGVPEAVPSGEATTIAVEILELADECVPGTEMLHYRYDGGAFQAAALEQIDGELYQATLPPAGCDDTPEYYFSAEGENCGLVCNPADAPASSYHSLVGELTIAFEDDFETSNGWTVVNDDNLTDGPWERAVPAGGGDRGDPPTDYDGSSRCFVTDNADDNSDVDDGITWLISPVFDLSGETEVKVDYALWYTNYFGNDPHNDLFKVHVTNNGGSSWVLAETVGPQTADGWTRHSFMLNDFVELNDRLQVRFEASDLDDGSVVEAGIDAFAIKTLECGMSDAATWVPGAAVRLHVDVPSSVIRYELPAAGPVELGIYDLAGRRVAELVGGAHQAAGSHDLVWNAPAPSGVYYCRLQAAGVTITRPLIRID